MVAASSLAALLLTVTLPTLLPGHIARRATPPVDAKRNGFLGSAAITSDAVSAPPSANPGPWFTDVSGELGRRGRHRAMTWSEGPDHGFEYLVTGQAWGDVDRDGDPDLYITNQRGRNTLFRNSAGHLSVWTKAGDTDLAGDISGGAVFADYDNDGYPDLLVLGYLGVHLLHNDGGLRFSDVTATSGLSTGGHSTTGSWADYDADGLLDLFVANYGCTRCDPTQGKNADGDRLFHNEGNGRFADVSGALPRPVTMGFTFVGGWVDFDDDGDSDLYVVNDVRGTTTLAGNALLRNDGAGCGSWCFTDVSALTGAGVHADGMGIAVGDADGDGHLDLFVTNSGWVRTPLTGPSVLLRSVRAPDGSTRFADVARTARADVDATAWGASFLDFDNDGNRDLYVAVGLDMPEVGDQANLDRLLHNAGDGTFRDASATSGVSYGDNTVGVATADFNGDGWMDLLTGDIDQKYSLYANNASGGSGNHRVAIRLEGRGRVNRDAVGSRVTLTTTDGRIQVQEVMAGTGLGGGSDLVLHFGLGRSEVLSMKVRWTDGSVQSLESIPSDSAVTLRYGLQPVSRPLLSPNVAMFAAATTRDGGRSARLFQLFGSVLLAMTGVVVVVRIRRRRRNLVTHAAKEGSHSPGGPGSLSLTVRGISYPIVLPRLADPRLQLASVITSLQVLGQTVFGFELSIAQILTSLGTCALIELVITFRRSGSIVWPASALLTGNGVAFLLRVPGTPHGDWWSTRGWWIFAGTAAISLLSKYLITSKHINGRHVFNPSNLGLVICFLVLGPRRVAPLDFWWGPMSPWMALALAIVVIGGLIIVARQRLLVIAVSFWVSFATGLAVLTAAGHSMTARWHLGPIAGLELWRVLVTSPETLVFLFFMITDPKTVPASRRGRLIHGVSIGFLAPLFIAPQHTEYATKVAVLVALTAVCAARPLLAATQRWRARVIPRPGTSRFVLAASLSCAYFGLLAGTAISGRTGPLPIANSALARSAGPVEVVVLPAAPAVNPPDQQTSRRIAAQLVTELMEAAPAKGRRIWRVSLTSIVGNVQGPPSVVALVEGADATGPFTVSVELVHQGERYVRVRSSDDGPSVVRNR